MRNVYQEINEIIQSYPVVLFMKGNFHFPQCGFSARAVAILKEHGLTEKDVKTINVLDDNEIRQGIKEYSHWPTIPQFYLNGDFIGGSDIMTEMHEDGELKLIFEQTQKV